MKNLVLATVLAFVGVTAFAHHAEIELEMDTAMDVVVQDFEEIRVSDLPDAVTTNCGMAYAIGILSGRWKLSIIGYLLAHEKLRYGELKRKIEGISERMLIAQLKELQSDHLIERIAYPEVPPRVEYKLTEKGRALDHILSELSRWGKRHYNENTTANAEPR